MMNKKIGIGVPCIRVPLVAGILSVMAVAAHAGRLESMSAANALESVVAELPDGRANAPGQVDLDAPSFPAAIARPHARADGFTRAMHGGTIRPSGVRKEVAVVDTSVAGYRNLMAGLPPGLEVLAIDGSQSGLAQIAAWAQTHGNYDAIHVLSHGDTGVLHLGADTIDAAALRTGSVQKALTSIRNALNSDGDLLLYGCNVAAGAVGAQLIQGLQRATGADVAASSDPTGAQVLGGDWELEVAAGHLESAPIVLAFYDRVLATEGFESGYSSGDTSFANSGVTFTLDNTLAIAEFATFGSGGGDFFIDSGYGQSRSGSLGSVTADAAHSFELTGLDLWTSNDGGNNNSNATIRLIGTKAVGGTVSLDVLVEPTGYTGNDWDTSNDVSAFSGIQLTALEFQLVSGANYLAIDNFAFTPQALTDATSTVTAGAGIEAANFATTASTQGSAIQLLDFKITDPGSSDSVATTVTAFTVDVTGTTTDAERALMVFLLNGNDATNVTGSYDAGTDKVTFSGLTISVADGANETYTISGYFNDNTGTNDITEDHTLIFTTNAADFTTGAGSTMAASQADVSNGGGAAVDVTATKLVYTQGPSGTFTSGQNFAIQPVVQAVDARANVDTDYTTNVVLSEDGSGGLSGTTTLAASAGVASFTNVRYTAASDADANFTLTASSGGLTAAGIANLDPDVVATTLAFQTQPAPTSIQSGVSTDFSTDPVVLAVDAAGTLDTGWGTAIVLAVTDPNDGTVDGTVNSLSVPAGDTDAVGTTVTLNPSSGSANFTGLALHNTATPARPTASPCAPPPPASRRSTASP